MTSLEEIKRLLAVATPGPWESVSDGDIIATADGKFTVCLTYDRSGVSFTNFRTNAQLIAKAPTPLAELFEQVERMQKVADAAEGYVKAQRAYSEAITGPVKRTTELREKFHRARADFHKALEASK